MTNAVSKEDIIPPVPILTRYRRESGIKAFVKKELNDSRQLNDPRHMRKSRDINVLTTPTLCVQLNTLYVSLIFNSNLCNASISSIIFLKGSICLLIF